MFPTNLQELMDFLKGSVKLLAVYPVTTLISALIIFLVVLGSDVTNLINFLSSKAYNPLEIITAILSILTFVICSKIAIDNEKNSIFSKVSYIRDSQLRMLELINISSTAIRDVVRVIININNKMKGIPTKELAEKICNSEIKYLLFRVLEYISKILVRKTQIDSYQEVDMRSILENMKEKFISHIFENSKGLLKTDCVVTFKNKLNPFIDDMIFIAKSKSDIDDKMLNVFLKIGQLEKELQEIVCENLMTTSFIENGEFQNDFNSYTSSN